MTIEELQNEISELKQKIDKQNQIILELEKISRLHKHAGYDKTQVIEKLEYIKFGIGTPEGSISARIGTIFLRQDGGAVTTLYIKESGTGNTGWVAK